MVIYRKKVLVTYEPSTVSLDEFIDSIRQIQYLPTGDLKFFFYEDDEMVPVKSIFIPEHPVKAEPFLKDICVDLEFFSSSQEEIDQWKIKVRELIKKTYKDSNDN